MRESHACWIALVTLAAVQSPAGGGQVLLLLRPYVADMMRMILPVAHDMFTAGAPAHTAPPGRQERAQRGGGDERAVGAIHVVPHQT